MKIGVLKETIQQERRVASTPQSIKSIVNLGYTVSIESDAGQLAGYSNDDYRSAGAEIIDKSSDIIQFSDILLKVREPKATDLTQLSKVTDKTLISLFWPASNQQALDKLNSQSFNVLAMDCVPRISRAQKLDVLSSMANIGGYRAVIEASHEIGRFLGGQMTAAGKIPPTKVLVIGAGVAGLAAIGAAASMGAVVRAFDTRPEVKEQVESLNAEFLMLDFNETSTSGDGYAKTMSKEFIAAEMALFAQQAKEVDVIITTALIPGKPAPKLITQAMVDSMSAGSVVIDMAAEQGGNCEYTVPGERTVIDGVSILGYTDLASRMAGQASQLYANNVVNLLSELTPNKNGQLNLNLEDEMIRGLTVASKGSILWPPPAIKVSAAKPLPEAPTPTKENIAITAPSHQKWWTLGGAALGACLLLLVGAYAPADFMSHFIVFILSCFVGWQLVWNVTPALHTPLMSVTNAISGIIVLGALLQFNSPSGLAITLAALATLLASINIAGGFLVTRRMLKMFQSH